MDRIHSVHIATDEKMIANFVLHAFEIWLAKKKQQQRFSASFCINIHGESETQREKPKWIIYTTWIWWWCWCWRTEAKAYMIDEIWIFHAHCSVKHNNKTNIEEMWIKFVHKASISGLFELIWMLQCCYVIIVVAFLLLIFFFFIVRIYFHFLFSFIYQKMWNAFNLTSTHVPPHAYKLSLKFEYIESIYLISINSWKAFVEFISSCVWIFYLLPKITFSITTQPAYRSIKNHMIDSNAKVCIKISKQTEPRFGWLHISHFE